MLNGGVASMGTADTNHRDRRLRATMVGLRDQNLRKAQDSFGRFETIIEPPVAKISRFPLSRQNPNP